MESSKKNLGKISPFGERIIKVLKDNGLTKPDGDANYSEAERLCRIKGGNLSKSVKAKGMHEENLKKFLGTFHVKRDWLLRGTGDQYEIKHTPVTKAYAIDKQADEILDHPLVKSFTAHIKLQEQLIAILTRENEELRGKK